MSRRRAGKNFEEFIAQVRARQRNIVWPDTMVNSRAVDVLFWRGSPNATPVQRIAIAIFGLGFLVAGMVFLSFAKEEKSWAVMILSYGVMLLGLRFLRNPFRGLGRSTGSK